MKENQNIKIAVDAVVFGYRDAQLFVLLVKQGFGVMQGQWVLPGGFVKNGEGLQQAVERELKEETGVELSYLEQLYTFGDNVSRDPRNQVVSVAYVGLVNPSAFSVDAGSDAIEVQWYPIDDIPKLGFDHREIVEHGLKRLQGKLSYQPIGFGLLDKEFPFSDLENLYQTILGRKIDRRNFRKKVLSFGFLKEGKMQKKIGSGRPAKLFMFDEDKYKSLEKSGMYFEIK